MIKFRRILVLLLPILGFIHIPLIITEATNNAMLSPHTPESFNLQLTTLATGLQEPTNIAHTKLTEDGRLFITERAGTIRIVNEDGTVESTPFLDISEEVFTTHIEAGLIGLVFDPDYVNNGYFYVMYTQKPSEDLNLSRFQVSSTNPNLADVASETVILNLPQNDDGHNGGDMHFDADGNLLVSIGDGGLQSEPNGQDFTNLQGAILRLDLDPNSGLPPECGNGSSHYSIPADNPFVGVQEDTAQDPCNEIWVYGLRNPWHFSLDRATQDLFIGDVGWYLREEINYLPANEAAGSNLGWACYEGFLLVNHKAQCQQPAPEYTPPVFDYTHDDGCAVAGGFVYRGTQSLSMIGHYLFADFCSGHIYSLLKTENGWAESDHGRFLATPSAFGEDVNGELYMVSLSEGRLYHLADDTIPMPRLSIHKTAPFKVHAEAPITYTLTISNEGNAIATNLVITDRLPTGAFYISGGSKVGNDVIWTVPILEPEHSVPVTMVITATQTVINKTYAVSADDDHRAIGFKSIITFVDPNEVFLPVIKTP